MTAGQIVRNFHKASGMISDALKILRDVALAVDGLNADTAQRGPPAGCSHTKRRPVFGSYGDAVQTLDIDRASWERVFVLARRVGFSGDNLVGVEHDQVEDFLAALDTAISESDTDQADKKSLKKVRDFVRDHGKNGAGWQG